MVEEIKKPTRHWAIAGKLRREFPSVEKRYTTQEVAELISKYGYHIVSHINEAMRRALISNE